MWDPQIGQHCGTKAKQCQVPQLGVVRVKGNFGKRSVMSGGEGEDMEVREKQLVAHGGVDEHDSTDTIQVTCVRYVYDDVFDALWISQMSFK